MEDIEISRVLRRDPVGAADDARARARAAVQGRLFGDARSPPRRIGRYVLGERLGAGGCAVVHRAWDPELRRAVAIKLVRAEGPFERASSRARLLREAKAIARLNHPNVASVYDVGECRGSDAAPEVFIVMELLEGGTLHTWLASDPPLEAVMSAFASVAKGLAHVHHHGLVHRDLKPANVLLTPQRQAKLVDFGLARASGESMAASIEVTRLGAAALGSWTTLEGAIIGTPFFMSPEQHRGEPVDSGADVYALCVALYWAIFRSSPFGDVRDLPSLVESKCAGPAPLPAQPRLSRRLGRTLRAGLHPDSDGRPSALKLAATLQGRGRRRGGWWAVAGGVTALSATGAVVLFDAPADSCADRHRIDQVWNAQRRDALEQAFVSTGAPHAAQTFSRVEARIDAFANSWQDVQEQQCREEAISHRAELCHGRELANLGAVLMALEDADRQTVSFSHRIVDGLETAPPCGTTLRAAALQPEAARAVQASWDTLALAETAEHSGRYDEALRVLQRLLPVVDALREPGLAAQVRLRIGSALAGRGDVEGARRALEEAFPLATEARDDATLARITARSVELAADDADLDRSVREARSLFERGAADDAGLLELALALAQSDLGASPQWVERALVLADDTSPRVRGRVFAVAAAVTADVEAALEYADRSVEAYEVGAGEQHPETAASLERAGAVQLRLGASERARMSYARAVAILEGALGAEHLHVAAARAGWASALEATGDLERAGEELETALALERRLGAPRARVQATMIELARVLARAGDEAGAKRLFAEAVAD